MTYAGEPENILFDVIILIEAIILSDHIGIFIIELWETFHMEKQLQEKDTKDNSKVIKRSHSVVGILSTICAVFALGAAILFYYLLSPNSSIGGSGLDFLGVFSIISMAFCSSLALILGIVGLFLKKRKKLFAIIGISIPGSFAIILAVVFLIGIIMTRFNTGKFPLRDNFNYEYWDTADNRNSSVQYYKGTLQFIVDRDFFEWTGPSDIPWDVYWVYENVHIEVTAITESTDPQTIFGIMCNMKPYSMYWLYDSYFFGITPKGEYAIGKISDQEIIILSNSGNWIISDMIKKNANSYRIGADCSKGILSLYVDGKKIVSTYDNGYPDGGFGLFVYNRSETTAIVGFDKFLMKKK